MPNLTIRNNRSIFQIYDVKNFLEMPLKNVRKLWVLMFAEAWNNEEALETVKHWLENYIDETSEKEAAMVKAAEYAEEMKTAAREAAAAAKRAEEDYKQSKRNHETAKKLKVTFHDLTRRYWF